MADPKLHSTSPPPPMTELAVVTGASKRIGAVLAHTLHAAGFDVLLHYHRSETATRTLADQFNARRPDSARIVSADLTRNDAATRIFAQARAFHPTGATVLVNNASTFFRTPLADVQPDQWEDLRRTNLDAPLWLSQAFSQQTERGVIINLTDAMVPSGIAGFAPYAAAKSGLMNLTRSLAAELAPGIRVNAVSPGSILWAHPEPDDAQKAAHLASIPLGRLGSPEDIADAVLFLIRARYITGQVLAVDGGRSL